MRWGQYDGKFMELLQDKTAEHLWITCPSILRQFQESLPKCGKYIMPKNLTQPLG